MKGLERFNYSQEAIAFQDGKLFNEIVPIFKKVKEDGFKYDFGTKIFDKTKLSDIVFKHTGIKITTSFVTKGGAYVFPPRLVQQNILYGKMSEQDDSNQLSQQGIEKLKKSPEKVLKGTVNLEKSMVGGAFSDKFSEICFSPDLFFKEDVLPEELAAIFLHELGHVFTYFEMLVETITTNIVISGVCKRVLETQNLDERLVIITNFENTNKLKIDSKEELVKSDNKNSIYTVLMKGHLDNIRSSSDSWVYDSKSWEFMADQFATRHGAGQYIASGLYKMHKSSLFDTSTKGSFANCVVSLIQILLLIGSVAVTPIFPHAILLFVLMVLGHFSLDLSPHDNLEQRLNRIKIDLMERLKDNTLTKEVKEKTIEEIEAINTMLSETSDKRTLIEAMIDYIRPARRDARKQYEFQMKMEKIAGNSLFLHAAKLSTLS